MGIVLWIVWGFVAGWSARLLMPGPDPLGVMWTIVLGIGGALAGGFIGNFTGGSMELFDLRSLVTAILGSMVLLFCYRAFAMRAAE